MLNNCNYNLNVSNEDLLNKCWAQLLRGISNFAILHDKFRVSKTLTMNKEFHSIIFNISFNMP